MTIGPTSLDRTQLGSLKRLGAGGQGVVYSAPRVRLSLVGEAVYKEYRVELRHSVDVATLERMVEFLESLSFSAGSAIVGRAAWPVRLVSDHGHFSGFIMPRLPGEFLIDIRLPSGKTTSARSEFQHLLNDDSFLARGGIRITDHLRYELLLDLVQGLELIHGHGITVGDLSPKNVLFSLGPVARTYFIDCDSMRLQGQSALPQVETPGWDVRATSYEALATVESDRYKLGLLALRLFAQDQDTRDVNRLPSRVPADLHQIIRDSLSSDPRARPALSAWAEPLSRAIAAAAMNPQAGAPSQASISASSAPAASAATAPAVPTTNPFATPASPIQTTGRVQQGHTPATSRSVGSQKTVSVPAGVQPPSRSGSSHVPDPRRRLALKMLFVVILGTAAVVWWQGLLSRGGDDSGQASDDDVTTISESTTVATPPPSATKPTVQRKTIGFGDTVSGTIASGNKPDDWYFTATKGDIITIQTFQVTGAAFRPAFTLYDPSGAKVSFVSDISGDYQNALVSKQLAFGGEYRISVGGYGGDRTVGDYEMSLRKKASPELVRIGDDISGAIEIGGDYLDYRIDLVRGQQIDVTVTKVDRLLPTVDLIDPSGTREDRGWGCVQAQKQNGFQRAVKFTGTYTLRVYSACESFAVGTFRMTLR